MKKFCPLCGKETDRLIDKLCDECHSKKPVRKETKKKKVYFCVRCERIKQGNVWVHKPVEENMLVVKDVCQACSRISGMYYEAIIQIRGNKKEKVKSFVEKKINELSKKDELSFISKIEEKKKGLDIYVGSKKAAKSILKEAKKLYNLETKESYTLIGERKGKKLYRVTILLRLI